MSAWRRTAGLFCVAVYALPLWAPPPAQPIFPPLPDATLLDRLFPGVPAWWIILRLACLGLGAALLAWRSGAADLDLRPLSTPVPPPRRLALRAAFVLAACLAAAACLAHSFSRPLQLAFALALPLPPLVTLAGQRVPVWRRPGNTAKSVLAIVALWGVLIVPSTWRSPWIANIADNLGPLNMVVTANDPSFNFLVDTIRPAQTGLFLLLEGGGWLGLLGLEPSLAIVAALNLAWLALTALILGALAARVIAPAAAPIATAFFLFSPSAQMMALLLGPLFVGPLLGGSLLLLLDHARRRSSAPSFLGAASITGFMATFPSMTPAAALAGLGLIAVAWRRRLPPLVVATAALAASAVVLPGLPSMVALREIVDFYAVTSGQWSTLEAASFGWLNPERVRLQLVAGWSGRFDPLLASLTLPFAAPRTAMRVLGDVLYDPTGTVFATIGMFACLFAARPLPLALLGLLGLSLAAGLLPGYDRVSAMRLILLPLPMTLLACIGFLTLRRVLTAGAATTRAGLACALLIALGGTWLGRVVQPSVLAQSVVGMVLEVEAANPDRASLALLPRGVDMSGGTVFLDQIPRQPVAWLAYDGSIELPPVAETTIWLWPPAVEERSPVAAIACQRGAQLVELVDRSRSSRLYAAHFTAATNWRIPAGYGRRELPCDTALPTEKQLSLAALQAATERRQAGDLDTAIDILRKAAQQSFTAQEVYDALAHTLMMRASTSDLDEAQRWAERAVRMCNACRSETVATLAAVQRARGDEAAANTSEAAARQAAGYCHANFRRGHPCRSDD